MDIEGREGPQPEGDEFNPLSEEEMREREEAEEFRRRVRREILRVQSGEADEDIARDREEEEAQRREGGGPPAGPRGIQSLCRRDRAVQVIEKRTTPPDASASGGVFMSAVVDGGLRCPV